MVYFYMDTLLILNGILFDIVITRMLHLLTRILYIFELNLYILCYDNKYMYN